MTGFSIRFLTITATSLSLALLGSCKDSSPSQPNLSQPNLSQPNLSQPEPSQTTLSNPSMVVSANPYATQAGLEVLSEGGSAVDAAIAVQTVLGLVEPQSSGLGGGAFMVLYDPKTAQVWSYDGRETAPENVSPNMFLDPETGGPIRFVQAIASGRSTGVPGAVVMLHRAHQDYGQLDWEDNFDVAITLAETGFKISPRMAAMIARMGPYALKDDPQARDYFFRADGTPLPAGTWRDNPAYAGSLRALAKNPRALLEGPIAQAIIDTTHREPLSGTLSLADMKDYQPIKSKALCSHYRGHKVCGAQPPSSGGVAVQSILGMVENFDMKKLHSAQGWHIFAEASFLAYADRDKYVADPNFVDVPTAEMLAPDYLKMRASHIKLGRANPDVKAGNPVQFARGKDATPDNPGTSHFTIIDKDGLVVSMTTTVESAFGSQRMVGGFMLNNQLTDFSFKAVDDQGLPIANAVAPKKRPRSSMAPHIVLAPNGEFLFSTGSPGGSSIIAYVAKTIIGIIDWNLSPQEAIELPNLIARNGSIKVEAQSLKLKTETTDKPEREGAAAQFGMDEASLQALEALGHKVLRSKGEISGVHIIYRRDDGQLIGGADPRREGTIGEIKPPN